MSAVEEQQTRATEVASSAFGNDPLRRVSSPSSFRVSTISFFSEGEKYSQSKPEIQFKTRHTHCSSVNHTTTSHLPMGRRSLLPPELSGRTFASAYTLPCASFMSEHCCCASSSWTIWNRAVTWKAADPGGAAALWEVEQVSAGWPLARSVCGFRWTACVCQALGRAGNAAGPLYSMRTSRSISFILLTYRIALL